MFNGFEAETENYLTDPGREFLPNWPPKHRNGMHYVCQNLECLNEGISPDNARVNGVEKKIPGGGEDYVMYACSECTTATGIKDGEAAKPGLDTLVEESIGGSWDEVKNGGKDKVPEYML